jgi:hypothetical protein
MAHILRVDILQLCRHCHCPIFSSVGKASVVNLDAQLWEAPPPPLGRMSTLRGNAQQAVPGYLYIHRCATRALRDSVNWELPLWALLLLARVNALLLVE